MSYKLKFTPISWKEWQKLDKSIQTQLKKKLSKDCHHNKDHIVAKIWALVG